MFPWALSASGSHFKHPCFIASFINFVNFAVGPYISIQSEAILALHQAWWCQRKKSAKEVTRAYLKSMSIVYTHSLSTKVFGKCVRPVSFYVSEFLSFSIQVFSTVFQNCIKNKSLKLVKQSNRYSKLPSTVTQLTKRFVLFL